MKIRIGLLAFSVNALFVMTATATPIQVNYDDIVQTTFEDFQSYPVGTKSNIHPGVIGSYFDFGNFSYDPFDGRLVNFQCNSAYGGSDNCLTATTISEDPRTFLDFVTGTNFLGFDLFADLSTDIFEVTVTSNSGVSVFLISGSGFYGFGDLSGLVSVSIWNLGTTPFVAGAYSFDDVILGEAIPLPAALPLFLSGLAGLGFVHRRRKRALK